MLLFQALPILSLACGFHYVHALDACQPVRKPAVIWFIEIIWHGAGPWRTRSGVFPMIWAWVYSFLLWNTHPDSTRMGPRMSNRAGQLNNNIHTVFTRLELHFLSGRTEALKGIQLWAGNHTEWELPLSLTINVTAVVGISCSGRGVYQHADKQKRRRLV